MELAVTAAEAGVVQDAVPAFAHDGGAGEALRLVRREADEDVFDEELDEQRRVGFQQTHVRAGRFGFWDAERDFEVEPKEAWCHRRGVGRRDGA